MLATHMDAEQRYTKIRQAVFEELNKELLRSEQRIFRAGLIDSAALSQSRLWNLSSRRKVNWDWVEGYSAFRFRHPKRFEMALWYNNTLASLSLGRPTYQGARLRLDFIEGNPDKPSHVKVFEPTFLAMVAYAHALGTNELRIMNPINAEVRSYYERFGFAYVSRGDYLEIRL